MATSVPASPVSPFAAAREAFAHTRRQLFPIRLERWGVLGLLAFLDQCGRTVRGGAGSAGGGHGGESRGPEEWGPQLEQVREALLRAAEWLSAHAALVLLAGLAGLVVVGLVVAAVLWLNARGVLMYADAVATGRAELARPWREHAAAASSYFGWSLGITIAAVFIVLVALLIVGATLLAFATGRLEGTGWLALAATLPVLALLLLALPLLALASLALRDFVAPLQLATGLPCEGAVQVLESLVIAQPGVFVLYLVVRLLIAVATGIVIAIGGCLTCCVGFIPVVMQIVFQPLFHFERGLAIMLLRQLGYDAAARLTGGVAAG